MPVRLLLVLGDPLVLKRLRALFVRQGYSCRSAPTLRAALAELRRAPYPVAVVDLELLGADPAAAARALRSAQPGARLIALDSLTAGDTGNGVDSPFDAVIAKPFFYDPLLAALAATA
ncbi:MAG TPA: hypothetical protein VNE39_12200 [Planctomycetota bacterium]|nr:hypothetical protein [Planctomycetota bacterium]